jgi:MFS transporter, FHS family, L-fucose permease
MITGVFGGAVIPFFMGILSDKIGSQNGSLIVILFSVVYLIYCSLSVVEKEKK